MLCTTTALSVKVRTHQYLLGGPSHYVAGTSPIEIQRVIFSNDLFSRIEPIQLNLCHNIYSGHNDLIPTSFA